VRKSKVDGGCYEVYGTDPQGRRVEAYFHPVSFEKLLVSRRGEVLFKRSPRVPEGGSGTAASSPPVARLAPTGHGLVEAPSSVTGGVGRAPPAAHSPRPPPQGGQAVEPEPHQRTALRLRPSSPPIVRDQAQCHALLQAPANSPHLAPDPGRAGPVPLAGPERAKLDHVRRTGAVGWSGAGRGRSDRLSRSAATGTVEVAPHRRKSLVRCALRYAA
jgi:hypothetical protein